MKAQRAEQIIGKYIDRVYGEGELTKFYIEEKISDIYDSSIGRCRRERSLAAVYAGEVIALAENLTKLISVSIEQIELSEDIIFLPRFKYMM